MKKTALFVAIAFLLGSSIAVAQQPDSALNKANPYVVNSSLSSKMLPMPEPLTTEKIFPAIGSYQLTQSNIEGAGNVTVSIDAENKGLVWIEGLPQGRIKAMLRKAPAVYRIVAQKTEAGTSVAEGTLVYDKDNNILSICIGCGFNEQDPTAVFANATTEVTDAKPARKSSKTKIKVWNYAGAKAEPAVETHSNIQ